jgi:hypothetical protein
VKPCGRAESLAVRGSCEYAGCWVISSVPVAGGLVVVVWEHGAEPEKVAPGCSCAAIVASRLARSWGVLRSEHCPWYVKAKERA